MFSSVRVRLTVWYTAVMTLVLAVLALTTYLVLRQDLFRRSDATLVELAESFLSTVRAELADAPGPNVLQQSVGVAISEHRFRNTIFVVLDHRGQILAASEEALTRDEAADALRQSIKRFRSTENSFRFVRLNKRLYRGYMRPFSVGNQDSALLVLQSLHDVEEFLESVAQTFGLIIPVAVLLASIGGYFLARQSLSPVVAMSDQAGRIGAENLHDRLAVKNAHDELGQLAKSFNALLDRLDHSFEQQRRFVADASHELRTPVSILCGEVDVALSQSSRAQEEYRESLQILGAEAHRLKHIIEDLFTLARADAGQHPLTWSDFYLDEIVAECSRNMRTLASAKHVTLECDAPKEMPIHADEALVRRMLINLLDNAIKYTPQGGTVSISSREGDTQYCVSVRDTGQGIPSDIQPRIFERFFRADKVRSRTESDGGGAGLGLAISLWIAEAHGGRIELTKSDQTGSTFSVFLPATAVNS